MSSDGLQIPVSLTLEEARVALKTLEAEARKAGAAIQDKLGGGAGAEKAKSGIFQLKEGMGRAREAAMFFSSSLSEFGPTGQIAQRALSGLVGALLGGGGLLLALEATRVAMSFFADAMAADRKKLEEVDKAIGDMVARAQERARAAKEELTRVQGGTRAVAISKFQEEWKAVTAEIKKERDESERLWGKDTLNRTQRYVELTEQRKKLVAAMREETGTLATTASVEAAREAASKIEAALTEAAKAGTEERARIRLETEQRVAELLKIKTPKNEADVQAAVTAVRSAGARQLAALDAKQAEERSRAAQDRLRAETDFAARRVALANAAVAAEAEAWRTSQEATLRRAMDVRQLARTGILGVDAQISEFEFEAAQRLAQIAEMEAAGLVTAGQAEIARTQIAREESQKRVELLRRESIQTRYFNAQIASSGRSMATAFVGEFGKMFRSSRAYEQAMRDAGQATSDGADLSVAAIAKLTQDTLASFAEQALVEGLMETARGIAAAARYDYGAAAQHFSAAAAFGIAGAAAGTAAMVLGNTRGMTKSERAQVDAARQSAAGSETTAPGAVPTTDAIGGYEGGAAALGGGGPVREIVYVIGDPFETPAETARRAARRMKLAHDLNMVRSNA
jgi:hypothetical protein